MTKKSIITQAELKRMAAVAKSESVTVTVEIDGRKFSVSPYTPPPPSRNGKTKLPDDFRL